MHFLLPFFRWADHIWIAEAIRDSTIYFPIIETFHLIALTMLFGSILILNLRLCGLVLPQYPVARIARDLAPWTIGSLIVILVSGSLLFVSEAMKCYGSVPFQVKMLFLFSALVFHFTIYRKVTKENEPRLFWGRLVSMLSVVLWLGVGLGGRGIAFL